MGAGGGVTRSAQASFGSALFTRNILEVSVVVSEEAAREECGPGEGEAADRCGGNTKHRHGDRAQAGAGCHGDAAKQVPAEAEEKTKRN